MRIPFKKMTGAGNDFVLIDNRKRDLQIDWPAVTPSICDRRYGIGADGLLVIEPSSKADFTMLYFNADGSFGGMCGNGGRCAALFMSEALGRAEVKFEALDHIYQARTIGSTVVLSMKDPYDLRLDRSLSLDAVTVGYHFVNTGAPHVVVYEDALPESVRKRLANGGVEEIGRQIRHHKDFEPEGANVDFITLAGDGTVFMRTYERGVEAETLACGTGAVACSVVAALTRNLASPVRVRTKSNETLSIHFRRDGNTVRDVSLQGPAVTVFEGTYTLGSGD